MHEVSSMPMDEDEKRFRAQSDIRTLVDAKKILKDPERMKAVKAVLQEQTEAVEDMGDKK